MFHNIDKIDIEYMHRSNSVIDRKGENLENRFQHVNLKAILRSGHKTDAWRGENIPVCYSKAALGLFCTDNLHNALRPE